MKKLKNEELKQIQGGANITGTLITSLARGLEVILELGRSLGSAFRRSKDNTLCSY